MHVDLLDSLPHGFLNFTLMSSECRAGAKIVVNRMREAFGMVDLDWCAIWMTSVKTIASSSLSIMYLYQCVFYCSHHKHTQLPLILMKARGGVESKCDDCPKWTTIIDRRESERNMNDSRLLPSSVDRRIDSSSSWLSTMTRWICLRLLLSLLFLVPRFLGILVGALVVDDCPPLIDYGRTMDLYHHPHLSTAIKQELNQHHLDGLSSSATIDREWCGGFLPSFLPCDFLRSVVYTGNSKIFFHVICGRIRTIPPRFLAIVAIYSSSINPDPRLILAPLYWCYTVVFFLFRFGCCIIWNASMSQFMASTSAARIDHRTSFVTTAIDSCSDDRCCSRYRSYCCNW